MFDLYLVITSIFALLSLLSVINLKFTLAESKTNDLCNYERKVSIKQKKTNKQTPKVQHMQEGFKKICFYLLKNFTVAEFILVRRSRNKIPLLVSISIIAILEITVKITYFYAFSGVGFIVTLIFFLIKMLSEPNNLQKEIHNTGSQNNTKRQEKYGKKLQILLTCLSLLINMTVVWIVYKNYKNAQLLETSYNFLITICVDNFLIKPISLLMLSVPLKFCKSINSFIDSQNEICQILRGQRVLKKQYLLQSKEAIRIKINNQTSNTENTIEIEPCVNFDINGNNLSLEKVEKKKQPLLKPIGSKKRQILEQSHTSILNNLSIPNKDQVSNFSVSNLSQDQSKYSFARRKNKIYLQKANQLKGEEIFQVRKYQAQNEEDEDIFYKKDFIADQSQFSGTQPIKNFTILNRSKFSKTQDLQNKTLGIQNAINCIGKDFIFKSNSKTQSLSQKNHQSYERSPNLSGIYDLLKIKQDKLGQDLGQIDMNSPERKTSQLRKTTTKQNSTRKMSINEYSSASKDNKNNIYKKFSLYPNQSIRRQRIDNINLKRQILSKQQNDKQNMGQKSHKNRPFNINSELDLSRKSDIFTRFSNDSRMAKSVKRAKNTKDPIVRQNNENQIPEFIIQDFTY